MRLSFRISTKAFPERNVYVLTALGRAPDEEEDILHRDWTLFHWDNLTSIEVDRFTILAKLHDLPLTVGEIDSSCPNALCVMNFDPANTPLFFEVSKRPKTKTVIAEKPVNPVSVEQTLYEETLAQTKLRVKALFDAKRPLSSEEILDIWRKYPNPEGSKFPNPEGF
jgi:hypothetical protein